MGEKVASIEQKWLSCGSKEPLLRQESAYKKCLREE